RRWRVTPWKHAMSTMIASNWAGKDAPLLQASTLLSSAPDAVAPGLFLLSGAARMSDAARIPGRFGKIWSERRDLAILRLCIEIIGFLLGAPRACVLAACTRRKQSQQAAEGGG